ncbi:hydroxymethylglutaryl-CoA lyase [Virgibacillus byunsanensis]|uniref:Hydroxymethylglutaryl-CoA lyase n=1 Tax=Virgibacillus byunsanensis TaxID=570945 RepID=A0ABW3LGD2_9BACI
MNLPGSVTINDVMLRDGLQLEDKILTVDEKYDLAGRLIEADIPSLEIGSFVHPKFVPQMANTGELFESLLEKYGSNNFITLVPNLKGAQRAVEHGLAQLNFVFSASNTHNLQNVRQTTEESLDQFEAIKEFCDEHRVKLDVSIATTFGCPFEGQIAENRIQSIVKRVTESEPNIVTLADTTGMANPKQVYYLMNLLLEQYPDIRFNLHFHNTRGMGLSNVLAGMEAGVTSFDTSLGGLGGCPFAPGATGNVCTEDVVHMLHSMGIKTGINLDELIDTSASLRDILGHELSSSVLKAGKYDRKYPVPTK